MIEKPVRIPKAGERWMFMGAGEGHGVVHTVLACDDGGKNAIDAEGMVTTWSDPIPPAENAAGYSWRGKLADFQNQFRPPAS